MANKVNLAPPASAAWESAATFIWAVWVLLITPATMMVEKGQVSEGVFWVIFVFWLLGNFLLVGLFKAFEMIRELNEKI